MPLLIFGMIFYLISFLLPAYSYNYNFYGYECASTRNSEFTLSAKLSSIEFIGNELSTSQEETSIYLDTFTQNHTVSVQKVVIELAGY